MRIGYRVHSIGYCVRAQRCVSIGYRVHSVGYCVRVHSVTDMHMVTDMQVGGALIVM